MCTRTRMEVSLEGPVKAEKGCASSLIKERHTNTRTHTHTHTRTYTHMPSFPDQEITNNK